MVRLQVGALPVVALMVLLALTMLPVGAISQAADPPCRVDHLDNLGFMIGDWTVRSLTRDAAGEWVETAGRATIERRLSGCLIEEVWEGELNGRAHRFVNWLVYDRDAGRWQRARVDDAHGSLLTAEGHWQDRRLRLFVSQFRGGRLLLDRTTIRPGQGRGFERELESSYDGGATWELVRRMYYEKRGED